MLESHPGLAEQHSIPNRAKNPIRNRCNNNGRIIRFHEGSSLLNAARKRTRRGGTPSARVSYCCEPEVKRLPATPFSMFAPANETNLPIEKPALSFFNLAQLLTNPGGLGGSMHALAQNLRFAFRQLGKAPGFTLTVIFTLALGVGATTAIFSLVEGILLRPLPFKDADRLVLLGDHLGNSPGIGVTAVEIATYAKATSAFSSMGATAPAHFELSGDTPFGGAPAEIP